MVYKEYYKMFKGRASIILKLVYVNFIVLLIGIAVSPVKLQSKAISIPLISLIVLLVFKINKKSSKKNEQAENKILDKAGEIVVINYFSSFSNGMRMNYSLIYKSTFVLYSFIFFILMVIVYSLFHVNQYWVIILSICHVVSFVPIVISLRYVLSFQYIFTTEYLIIDYKKYVPYGRISKYQVIELMKKGYLIDINTGDNFIRLYVDDNSKEIIQNLMNKN